MCVPDRSPVAILALFATGVACSRAKDPPPPLIEKAAPVPAEPVAQRTPHFSALIHIAGRGELDREGESLWKAEFEGRPATNVEFSRPYFAMADAVGHVYIADKEAHALRRMKLDGSVTTWAGTGESGDDGDGPRKATDSRLAEPNGLWVLRSSVVFVLDLGNGKVRRIEPDGTMTTLFTVEGGIDTGRGLWVAPDGKSAFVSAASRLLSWSRAAGVSVLADGFSSLANLLVEDDGSILACDRGGDRVFRVKADGTVEPFAGTGDGGGAPDDGTPALELRLDGPRSIVRLLDGTYVLATHESGQLWEIGSDGGAVRLYDPDPGFEPQFELTGSRPSKIRGLSLTPDGALLLTHGDEGQIHRLEPAH